MIDGKVLVVITKTKSCFNIERISILYEQAEIHYVNLYKCFPLPATIHKVLIQSLDIPLANDCGGTRENNITTFVRPLEARLGLQNGQIKIKKRIPTEVLAILRAPENTIEEQVFIIENTSETDLSAMDGDGWKGFTGRLFLQQRVLVSISFFVEFF